MTDHFVLWNKQECYLKSLVHFWTQWEGLLGMMRIGQSCGSSLDSLLFLNNCTLRKVNLVPHFVQEFLNTASGRCHTWFILVSQDLLCELLKDMHNIRCRFYGRRLSTEQVLEAVASEMSWPGIAYWNCSIVQWCRRNGQGRELV